ncbi:MAG: hypothetical protein CMN31_02175, partial [Sandaracinus sp.]|nr:hypothetical protein [Sandaracinus sp.]
MPRPFFVVGAPRTGTTLLRRVLVAHPDVAIPPESFFLAEYLEAEHVPLARRLALWVRDPELIEWGQCFTERDFEGCEDMAAVVRRAHALFAEREGARVWGQKTPRLVRYWALLSRLFPDAVFLHPTRDPRAVVSSLARSPAHQLNALVGARRWRDDTAIGIEMERALGERVLRYDYEELATDPEGTARRVCAHLDIDFDPAMLEAPSEKLRLKKSEERAGHHTNVAAPISAASVERWREDLSAEEQAVVAHVTGEVARALGYAVPDAGPPSSATRLRMAAGHGWTSVRKAVRDVTTKPEILQLARRHAALGSFGRTGRPSPCAPVDRSLRSRCGPLSAFRFPCCRSRAGSMPLRGVRGRRVRRAGEIAPCGRDAFRFPLSAVRAVARVRGPCRVATRGSRCVPLSAFRCPCCRSRAGSMPLRGVRWRRRVRRAGEIAPCGRDAFRFPLSAVR